MVVLRRSDARVFNTDAPAGTWIRWHWPWPFPAGRPTAAMPCPKCNRAFCLAEHTIAGDGRVSPSVVCPHGCGYHVMMKLDGWP